MSITSKVEVNKRSTRRSLPIANLEAFNHFKNVITIGKEFPVQVFKGLHDETNTPVAGLSSSKTSVQLSVKTKDGVQLILGIRGKRTEVVNYQNEAHYLSVLTIAQILKQFDSKGNYSCNLKFHSGENTSVLKGYLKTTKDALVDVTMTKGNIAKAMIAGGSMDDLPSGDTVDINSLA